MQVTGKVEDIQSDISINKTAGGSYQGSRIIYRDATGSLKEQNFHNNALKFNPELKAGLLALSKGDNFVMTKEKEGEFWNVKSIAKAGAQESVAAAGKGNAAPRSNYETPEERAFRQVCIVRQSTISAAIALAGLDKKAKTVEEILAVARQFECHVFDKHYDDGTIEGMEDDMPD